MATHPLQILGIVALVGCAQVEPDNVSAGAEAPLQASAFAQPLVRLQLPLGDELGDLTSLVETSSGYAAMYRRSLGEGKVANGWVHRVFLSNNGLSWAQHDVPERPTWVTYRTLAFGAGRFLLAGQGGSSDPGQLATSPDGIHWQDVATELPEILTLSYLNERFFALGLHSGIFSSRNGVAFIGAPTDTLQLNAIAYGRGTFIAVGSGPVMVSHDDAISWSAVPLDCALPDACVTPPGASSAPGMPSNTSAPKPLQGYRTHALFGNGHFVVDGFISDDALSWRAIADESRVPDAFVGGWFLKLEADRLSAWRDDEPALSTAVSDDNPEQLDCRTHRCLLFRDAIILVP